MKTIKENSSNKSLEIQFHSDKGNSDESGQGHEDKNNSDDSNSEDTNKNSFYHGEEMMNMVKDYYQQ